MDKKKKKHPNIALYRRKSLPSVPVSSKRRERGGKPLTKTLDQVRQEREQADGDGGDNDKQE